MTANVEPWPPNKGIERLAATRFTDVRWVPETGSTNADLLALARDGRRGPLVLLTDHQNAGRGRQNRSWFDEPGDSMLVSALVPGNSTWAPLVPLATGLAAVTAVEQFLGATTDDLPVGLKWPNDVLSTQNGEPKLAGILVEARTGGVSDDGVDQVMLVIGMGLNLRWSSPPPDEVLNRGTTLELLVGHRRGDAPTDHTPTDYAPTDHALGGSARNDMLIGYLTALDEALDILSRSGGRDAILARYRSRCLTLDRDVTFATADGEVTGTATDLGPDGELIVTDGDGRKHRLVAGDAHHRST